MLSISGEKLAKGESYSAVGTSQILSFCFQMWMLLLMALKRFTQNVKKYEVRAQNLKTLDFAFEFNFKLSLPIYKFKL